VRRLEEVSADLRETQVYAEALAREVGDGSQSRLLDLNVQMLQANMFKLLAAKDGEGILLEPKDAKAFRKALRNIALTRKTDLDVVEKAEARAAARPPKRRPRRLSRRRGPRGLARTRWTRSGSRCWGVMGDGCSGV
jgi:hypothetical protein